MVEGEQGVYLCVGELVPKTVPRGPERSRMRLRPRDRTIPRASVTTAPMGKEEARYASQASSTHACQGSDSPSHTVRMMPPGRARCTQHDP